jgi:hypothetical protein
LKLTMKFWNLENIIEIECEFLMWSTWAQPLSSFPKVLDLPPIPMCSSVRQVYLLMLKEHVQESSPI